MKDDVTSVETYVGPIPPPQTLAQFKDVDPTFPERIFKMAEAHNEANIREQNRLSWAKVALPLMGQILTFLLGIAGIVGAVLLARYGKNGAALASVICGFSSMLASAFANLKK